MVTTRVEVTHSSLKRFGRTELLNKIPHEMWQIAAGVPGVRASRGAFRGAAYGKLDRLGSCNDRASMTICSPLSCKSQMTTSAGHPQPQDAALLRSLIENLLKAKRRWLQPQSKSRTWPGTLDEHLSTWRPVPHPPTPPRVTPDGRRPRFEWYQTATHITVVLWVKGGGHKSRGSRVLTTPVLHLAHARGMQQLLMP